MPLNKFSFDRPCGRPIEEQVLLYIKRITLIDVDFLNSPINANTRIILNFQKK